MTMVMATTSNQTMAFCSSISNSPIQRRDIQCNASDKANIQGPFINKGNHKEVIKGTPEAEDTKRWGSKRDDQKLKEKNLELKEKNLELREEILQLKEEILGLRGESQRLKDERTKIHYILEIRELEHHKENETNRLRPGSKSLPSRKSVEEEGTHSGNLRNRVESLKNSQSGDEMRSSFSHISILASLGLHSNGKYALNVSRKAKESFRKYAWRWKQTTIDVQPPMTDKEECRYFLKSLKDSCYELMPVVSFEDFSHLITMGQDIDFKTQEGHMPPLIGAQLNTTLTKTLPSSFDVPYLLPLPECQKAIEPFTLNIPTIPSTCFLSPPTPCITIHAFEPCPYTSNRVVTQAEGTQ
ncbi:gag-pro [Senna tora]|uniref:Gag-pro n=1 Tax=Senna tora TaxID=362788 RepID=A0A834WPJ6_9FABA|nr:gag-pro [Senna tora]